MVIHAVDCHYPHDRRDPMRGEERAGVVEDPDGRRGFLIGEGLCAGESGESVDRGVRERGANPPFTLARLAARMGALPHPWVRQPQSSGICPVSITSRWTMCPGRCATLFPDARRSPGGRG